MKRACNQPLARLPDNKLEAERKCVGKVSETKNNLWRGRATGLAEARAATQKDVVQGTTLALSPFPLQKYHTHNVGLCKTPPQENLHLCELKTEGLAGRL